MTPYLSTKATCVEAGLLLEQAAGRRAMSDEGLWLGDPLETLGSSALTSFSAVSLAGVHLHLAQDRCVGDTLPPSALGSWVHAAAVSLISSILLCHAHSLLQAKFQDLNQLPEGWAGIGLMI